jgi:uncharacterized protein YbjT (DUF2867 family)
MSTPIIAGSTGLVGSKILSCLSDQNHKPIALARSTIKLLPANAHELIVDYDSLLTKVLFQNVIMFLFVLALQSRLPKSKENFKKVDLDYPLVIAQKALDSGAKKLTLISSVGADSQSKNFYLRTKGELEDAILELGYESVNIFRPSFLIGRGGRHRAVSEKIFMRPPKYLIFFVLDLQENTEALTLKN